MLSKEMIEIGSKRSTIREIFEFGKRRAEIVGRDKIYDFSIGNPNVPAPELVKKAIIDILENEDSTLVHGYTSAQGDDKVRESIANSVNKRFGTNFTKNNLYMTVGAAASISICFKALSCKDDEFITFAPFFPEYRCFVEATGARLVVVSANTENFQINFEEFEKKINKNTKAIIVNSPNNPSGVVYSEETILKLTKILEEKSLEYGHVIYLISDEPYREIAYKDVEVPYLTKYYKNTFVCYSYSKSLSLPGERIGYVIVPDEIENFQDTYAAVCGAGRVLGYVNAPSLFQKVVAKCADQTSDISIYERNKELLYNSLIEMGYKCVEPGGAFYLFPQSLEPDAKAFCEKAREYDLLLVPGDDFGCPGHVRISYCVQTEQIINSLPVFKKLAEDYNVNLHR
ncbi:pyridoxal phosphate-dependent aminotransferase [Clostridium sp.]|uniref:pyridoxal phosphate-dependent aminotransferase n=1 Tax=Clostridium sp. TaxID=1506 RepID=UPI00285014E1|nr:pyridoxal phosphate-dependent aminotransferase [Clostridium sp.]MDR3595563.1 pyridoxal phosphate-dependent aminotransferase [Clostridium sp.]